MDAFPPSTRTLKQTLLKFLTRRSCSERSPTQTVTQIFPEESSNPFSFIHSMNKVSELPSHDIMATASSYPAEVVLDKPVVNKGMNSKEETIFKGMETNLTKTDRWLGLKILEVAVANVALRSIPTHASEEELQDLHESLIDNFRYEECYKASCSPKEPSQPNANFRNLLLGQIGHIYRRNQIHESITLYMDLENYVDDPRRHQNEKYIIQQESNVSHKSDTGALLESQLKSCLSFGQKFNSDISIVPPISLLQADIRNISKIPEDGSALPMYTTKVMEYGEKIDLRPLYRTDPTQSDPERFVSTVSFGDFKVRGRECKNKKSAKHEASKALWNRLLSTNGD